MLHTFLVEASKHWSVLNVFRYITVRSVLSFFTTFLVCWSMGPAFIRWLQAQSLGQSIRTDGPQTHQKKKGTPTMGGLLMMAGTFISLICWFDWMNHFVWGTAIITFGYACIGYWDDYLKVSKKNTKGVSGKVRLLLEFAIAGAVFTWLVNIGVLNTVLYLPFLKEFSLNLGWGYVAFAALVVVAAANAVNLTDGLDGLAIVPVIVSAGTLMLLTYLAGHARIADYLTIPYIPGAGELAPFCAAIMAAGLGFLWFNTYPAQVFMGDVGSLSLGGFLGTVAVISQNELLLIVLGGVFVVEALSVISQVASFKLTGKRIFKMAPLHHHFELKGLDETKIIVRFWIISILLAVFCLSTLKLR